DIQLHDLTQDLKATLPTELIGKYFPGIRKELSQIFPQGIPLSLKGPTTKPQIAYDFNVGDIQQRLVAELTKSNLGSVLGGRSPNKEDNPVGGLLDALAGDKKRSKDAKPDEPKMQEKPEPPPPGDAASRRPRGPRYRTTGPATQPATQPAERP